MNIPTSDQHHPFKLTHSQPYRQVSTAKNYLLIHNHIRPTIFGKKDLGPNGPPRITPFQATMMKERNLAEAVREAVDVEIQYTSPNSIRHIGPPSPPTTILTFEDGSILAWLTNQTNGYRIQVQTHDSNPCGCTAAYGRTCT